MGGPVMNAALSFSQQQVAAAMASLSYQDLYDEEFARHHGLHEWGLRTRLIVGEEVVGFTLRYVKGDWELDRDGYVLANDPRFPNGLKTNVRTNTVVKHNVLELFDSQVASTMLVGAYVAVLQAEFVMIRQRLMHLQTPQPETSCTLESQ